MKDKNERNLWTPSDLNARYSSMTTSELLQAYTHTPVFNRPDLDSVYGETIAVDSCGLNRALEYVALPETVFEVIERSVGWNGRICKVKTQEYPSTNPLYVDVRFCQPVKKAHEVVRVCPTKYAILEKMNDMVRDNLPYVWGGNVSKGVEYMDQFYPLPKSLSTAHKATWLMKGVDCSGMLYEATNGYTPRNTRDLTSFGRALQIQKFYDPLELRKLQEGMDDTIEQEKIYKAYLNGKIRSLIEILEPLDIVVWYGHVFTVLDRETSIESRFGKGCHTMPLAARLAELMGHGGRYPVNDYEKSDKGGTFTIRRWYGLIGPQEEKQI